MMRRVLAALVFLAAVGGAGRVASAQSSSGMGLRLTGINADSVFGAIAGGEVDVVVGAYDYSSQGIASFNLALHFDPARVEFVSAAALCPDSATYPLTATTFAAGVRLAAAGCRATAATLLDVARVRVRLLGGAADGSLLYLHADSVTDFLGTNRLLDSWDAAAQVCHATGIWGDIDGDGNVNSRDALIALSYAVGLPTGGFDLTRGDVDNDKIVSSRDALYMLTASIGGYVGGSRIGRAAIDRCAPDVAIGRQLYFVRGNTTPGTIANGSGLAFRAAGDTAYTLVGDSAVGNGPSEWRPRIAPDGSVLFICYAGAYPYPYYNICRSDANGANLRVLTGDGYYYRSPDWSPDGTRIVAVRSNQLVVMDSNGANLTVLSGSPSSVNSVSWRPEAGSNRIAYTTYGDSIMWRAVDSTGSDELLRYAPNSYVYDYGMIEWSPAGDSLAFDVYHYSSAYRHSTWVGAATPGFTPRPRFGLSLTSGNTSAPVWTDLGQLFGYYDSQVGRYRLFFLRADGVPFRLMRRDLRDHYVPGMRRQ